MLDALDDELAWLGLGFGLGFGFGSGLRFGIANPNPNPNPNLREAAAGPREAGRSAAPMRERRRSVRIA